MEKIEKNNIIEELKKLGDDPEVKHFLAEQIGYLKPYFIAPGVASVQLDMNSPQADLQVKRVGFLYNYQGFTLEAYAEDENLFQAGRAARKNLQTQLEKLIHLADQNPQQQLTEKHLVH